MAVADLFLPPHPQLRARLWRGFAVMMGMALLWLVPVNLGLLGSPWPLALVWAAAGWARSGPRLVPALLIALAGVWLDLITGGPLFAWAFTGLTAYGLTLIQQRVFGKLPHGVLQGLASGGFAFAGGAFLALLRGDVSALPGLILPCLLAGVLFGTLETLYSLDEERDTR